MNIAASFAINSIDMIRSLYSMGVDSNQASQCVNAYETILSHIPHELVYVEQYPWPTKRTDIVGLLEYNRGYGWWPLNLPCK